MNYRIFDLEVFCNTKIPDLPTCLGDEPDLRVEFSSSPLQDISQYQIVHSWRDSGGEITLECARHGDQYLLRFPEVALFLLHPGNFFIQVFPIQDELQPEARQLLLDQVIPRMLFHRGRVVLHASAVRLEDGSAVAFLGDTGRGKSTTAANFHQAGAELLSDDSLLIETADDQLTGIPAYPGLRLWPDSVDLLDFDLSSVAVADRGDGKFRILFQSGETGSTGVQLAALFVLGDPVDAPDGDAIICTRVRGSEAMIALIQAAFVLDLVSADAVQNNFRMLGELARQNIPVYHLNFARRHESLASVRQVVQEIVAKIR